MMSKQISLPADTEMWEKFLKENTGEDFKVLGVEPLEKDLTSYAGGLGEAVFIKLEDRRLVAKISKTGGMGRDYPEDRAKDALWTFRTSTLPRQPKTITVGSLKEGQLVPFCNNSEYFVVLQEALGRSYHLFLSDALKRGKITDDDRKAALNLSDYLVGIHKTKGPPSLYKRHLIDVFGGPEGIAGVSTYLWNSLSDQVCIEKLGKSKTEIRKDILELKKKAVEHADRIEDLTHRSSQMHGDFHPFENVRYEKYPDEYWILDRSRAEYGEPADDVTSMWMNYLNHALLDKGSYSDKFGDIGKLFFNNYLQKTSDYEMLKTVQPFFIWRGLVISNPTWYPNTPIGTRNKIFNFMKNVSDVEEFDPKKVNSYLSE